MNGRSILTITLLALASYRALGQRVIHVLVALCDNANQGIVKVPAALGNGQDPNGNLYWGAAYGVRSWFNRSKEWKRMEKVAVPNAHVLERIIWKHATEDAYLVADAYDGASIEKATRDLLGFAGGHDASTVTVKGRKLPVGGGADLIAYCGHDGLMDFAPPTMPGAMNSTHRDVIILACMSKRFFSAPLKGTGATPLLWSTGLMAPEAYTLDAALQGWIMREGAQRVLERAAQAYAKWQKCSADAARKLLVSGW